MKFPKIAISHIKIPTSLKGWFTPLTELYPIAVNYLPTIFAKPSIAVHYKIILIIVNILIIILFYNKY